MLFMLEHIFNCNSDNFIMEAYSMGPDETASINKLNWVYIESHWEVVHVLEISPEDKYWNETLLMITNI